MRGKKQVAAPESAFGEIVRDFETKGNVDRAQLETLLLPALRSAKTVEIHAEDETFLAALLLLLNRWLHQHRVYQSVFGTHALLTLETTLWLIGKTDLFVPLQAHWPVLFQQMMKAALREENTLLKREALRCIGGMLGHLDRPLVRTEMMKYVSIGTWSCMQDDRIRQHYIENAPVAKFWRNATKKLATAGTALLLSRSCRAILTLWFR